MGLLNGNGRDAHRRSPVPGYVVRGHGLLDIALALHTDLFGGAAGELLLGLMGAIFVVSIVSGVALYGPYMKKLAFGTVRHDRTRRLRWLDLHNLLGIVVLAWMIVAGATGVLNELAGPLFALWQRTDVEALLASRSGQPAARQEALASIQQAFDTASAAVPTMRARSVVYPGVPTEARTTTSSGPREGPT